MSIMHKEHKEKIISDYLSSEIDFNDINNISIKKIKQDLRVLLGEEPAIQLNYKKQRGVNEGGKETYQEFIESMSITFTYEDKIRIQDGTFIDTVVPVEKKIILS